MITCFNSYILHLARIVVPVVPCLMMLSGCSETVPELLPCPQMIIPEYLLAPCELPDYQIRTWGDFPYFTSRLQLAINKCNSDKEALRSLLLLQHP
ncbi:Uncharacterised protein [Enterobacter cancerogenus]|uniref:Peptidase n=1 Tax=Enterobacter cancerogenus TaxID=69218 RepID=A0A484WW71_9ENTR|nr:Uncharacterised protein [Enterobacter cancerogenus]